MNRIIPILKWAGGKRQLLPKLLPIVPTSYNRYYEPFIGAGALLFALQPSKAVINDANTELMNVYQVIKTSPDALIDILKEYEEKHNKEFYYHIRNIDRDIKAFEKTSDIEKAARTIYLNRTCYNGLYRVNKSGFFNTPIGRNTSVQIVNKEGILRINKYLNESKIRMMNTDYKKALATAKEGDLVFLDPPYFPTNRDSFLRYDANPFNEAEQIRLKKQCDRLRDKGVMFIETNSDCEEIRELYSEYNQIQVDVRRSINANADHRRGTELIITNK